MKSLLKLSKSVLAIAVFSVFAVGCTQEEEAGAVGEAEIGAEAEGALEAPTAGATGMLEQEPIPEAEGALGGAASGATGALEEGVAGTENVLEGAVGEGSQLGDARPQDYAIGGSSGASGSADVIDQDAGVEPGIEAGDIVEPGAEAGGVEESAEVPGVER